MQYKDLSTIFLVGVECNCQFGFVLSTFSILVFGIIGNCFGEDGLGVNPERLPLKDESSL